MSKEGRIYTLSSQIFDMQEFYSFISLEMQRQPFSKAKLRKSCITVIRFGGSDLKILRIPCWVAVININALNVLDNDQGEFYDCPGSY